MTLDTISLRRRHLLIAGVVGAATPVIVFAGRKSKLHEAPSRGTMEKLVVSGRIAGALDGKPLAGAVIEAWPTGSSADPAVVATDADGRFVLTTMAPTEPHDRPRALRYRVRYAGRELPAQTRSSAAVQWQRDDTGVWRTSLGLSVA